MTNNENYRVAIDILCCHLGMSFDEACTELGITEKEEVKLEYISDTEQSLLNKNPNTFQ